MNLQKILTIGNTLKFKYYTVESVRGLPQADIGWESLSSKVKICVCKQIPWNNLAQAVQEMDTTISLHFKNICYSLTPIKNYPEAIPIPLLVPFKRSCSFSKKVIRNWQWNQLPSSMSTLDSARLLQHTNNTLVKTPTGQKVLSIHPIKTQPLPRFARGVLTSFPSWAGALGGRGRRR